MEVESAGTTYRTRVKTSTGSPSSLGDVLRNQEEAACQENHHAREEDEPHEQGDPEVQPDRTWEGEGDFVVAVPDRAILIVEVKGGAVECRDGRWLQNGTPMKRAPRVQAQGFLRLLKRKLEERRFRPRRRASGGHPRRRRRWPLRPRGEAHRGAQEHPPAARPWSTWPSAGEGVRARVDPSYFAAGNSHRSDWQAQRCSKVVTV